jgi:hypothetical protein
MQTELDSGVVVLKKINRLENLRVQPTLYNQDTYNPEEQGVIEGQYKGNTLLGSKRNVTPSFDSLKQQWSFSGTLTDLMDIQKELKLRDPDGQLIKIEEDSLVNPYDKFWGHMSLYTNKVMEEGSTALNPKNALDRLMIMVHKGSSFVKNTSENQSAYVLADSNLELISPRAEIEKEAKSVDKLMKAITLLAAMGVEKMSAVAYLMELPGHEFGSKDPEKLKGLLSAAATNLNENHKLGRGITFQDRFIELAESTNEELNMMQKVFEAKLRGAITPNVKTGYTFKGERLDDGNIRDDRALMRFYMSPKNYERYNELTNYLSDSDELFKK